MCQRLRMLVQRKASVLPHSESQRQQIPVRSQGRQLQGALIGKLLLGLEDEQAVEICDDLGRAGTVRAPPPRAAPPRPPSGLVRASAMALSQVAIQEGRK